MSSKKKSKQGSTSRAQKPASKQPEVEAVATPSASSPATDKATKSRASRQRGQLGAKKLSALDAAAKVLEETGQPMTCTEMIAAMAKKGYWASPAGKTPASTLYSALLREVNTKGDAARFHKTGRGQFARKTQDS